MRITPVPPSLLQTFPLPGNNPEVLRLRNELVEAFPDPNSSREVMVAAGLDQHSIFWGQSARGVWREIIDYARARGGPSMASLLSTAIRINAASADSDTNGTCRCIDAV